MDGALSAAYGWLIAGAVLLALEAFGVPGIGFLFAGLAAIVVGLLIHLNVIATDDLILQAAAFFGVTSLLALLLWKKLKQWRTDPQASNQFHNIVGDFATIGKGGLAAGQIGQVSWSGTTMMARLDASCAETELAEGAMVTITTVEGNHLIVAPQTPSQQP